MAASPAVPVVVSLVRLIPANGSAWAGGGGVPEPRNRHPATAAATIRTAAAAPMTSVRRLDFGAAAALGVEAGDSTRTADEDALALARSPEFKSSRRPRRSLRRSFAVW